MKYHYFVSWIYCEGTTTRYANSEIGTPKPIDGIADIVNISNKLAEDNKFSHGPTILFYSLMRVEESEVDTE